MRLGRERCLHKVADTIITAIVALMGDTRDLCDSGIMLYVGLKMEGMIGGVQYIFVLRFTQFCRAMLDTNLKRVVVVKRAQRVSIPRSVLFGNGGVMLNVRFEREVLTKGVRYVFVRKPNKLCSNGIMPDVSPRRVVVKKTQCVSIPESILFSNGGIMLDVGPEEERVIKEIRCIFV